MNFVTDAVQFPQGLLKQRQMRQIQKYLKWHQNPQHVANAKRAPANRSHAATEPELVIIEAITPNHQLLIISFGLSDSKSEPGTSNMATA